MIVWDWVYSHLLQPFIRVATISTVVWLVGQWMGFIAPEITARFRRISLAIMRAVIPPRRKWFQNPQVWIAITAATGLVVFIAVKRRK